MNERYRKAYVEVLEIISNFSEEEYSNIPEEKIKFYESNKDKDYIFEFDPNKDLKEQNVSKEAKAIIVDLFREYFATEDQKEKLELILKENEEKLEEKKNTKYGTNNVFNDKTQEKNISTDLIVRSENIFTKVWNFIKGIFKK